MKLAIINGSPRNRKSNSKILADKFIQGYNSISNNNIPQHFLAVRKNLPQGVKLYEESEVLIFIFPLYTDSMPGIVKEYFEKIYLIKDKKPKRIGYIVQSGFPESVQSEYLERYLEKFTRTLGIDYLGTVIKGGVEGIQIMPPRMTKKLFGRFEQLGKYFAENEAFDPNLQAVLRKPHHLSKRRLFFFRIMRKIGLANYYWNSRLKMHNAYEKRFDRPFDKPYVRKPIDL